MKKLLAIISILGVFALHASAQVKREAKPSTTTSRKHHDYSRSEKHKMMKDLNFSKQQKQEMKDFKQSMKQKKEAISNDGGLTQEQKKQKMMELKKEKRQKMQSLLTPEQKEKLKKERMEMKKSHENK